MKQNLVGKILGKIKIFVQDFVTIVTGITRLSELVRDLTVKTLVESAVLLCGLESACTEWI